MPPLRLALISLAWLALTACQANALRPAAAYVPTDEPEVATAAPAPPTYIPFGMLFPPPERICDYPVVQFFGRHLLDEQGDFDPAVLDIAQGCGTQVILRLTGRTSNVLNDSGVGLSLARYEDAINDFAGLIDPYVANGTILAHFTIDEPHDCQNDWGGQCPTPAEVDEAGRLSRKYWPTLLTMINTSPSYAGRYHWQYTDIVNFQYSFHKGSLEAFINGSLAVLEEGQAHQIAWSIQATRGGCDEFNECPMTPSQIEEVGRAMCATGRGAWLYFTGYREEFMTPEVEQAIQQVRVACGE
ncbi:MAG: hypothetical protein AB1791_03685 [Chloroflexota bacterium]